MAHDYATRGRAGRKQKASSVSAGPIWLLTGVCLGLFLAFLLQLGGISLAPGKAVPARQAAQPAGAASKSKQQTELQANKKTPRFEFYSLLPEAEVEVLEEQQSAASSAERTSRRKVAAPLAATVAARRYLLQAGSFKDYDDADRLRANLLLLGLDANLEKFRLNSNDLRHRVQVGPFATRADMLAARQQLKQAGIDSLLLERRGP